MPIILIVGAADFVRDMREDALSAGFRVACAPDGSQALTAITHEKPALVVVDRAMPDLDRQWFLTKLERAPALARIPRAVLRSHSELFDVEDREQRQHRDRNQRRRHERDGGPTTVWSLRGAHRA